MKNRSFCNPVDRLPATDRNLRTCLYIGLCICLHLPCSCERRSGLDARRASLPRSVHDEKTDAVLLFSEHSVNVQSLDKIKLRVRVAYKILRPSGREYGVAAVSFNPQRKITALRGWCIPAQGKDYEVKDKEAIEVSLPRIAGSELISDVKDKVLRIPAADPGNVVGYEYEAEERPMVLQQVWRLQQEIPGRELHYSLQLPSGWEFKASWINYAERKPTQTGPNQWEWVVSDVKGIRKEEEMPPIVGVAGQMVVSFFPPGGAALNGFANWSEMGKCVLQSDQWPSRRLSGNRSPGRHPDRSPTLLWKK